LRPVFEPLPQKTKERLDALQKELARQKAIEAQRLKFFEDLKDLEETLFTAEEYAHNSSESDQEQFMQSLADSLKKSLAIIKLPESAFEDEQSSLQDVIFFLYYL